jgi:alkanesulfonate monooxygenase SsuD/methylene tetrahydromethanopterin reductase-like flavin-dependent oxidoreductase (luciferase family)
MSKFGILKTPHRPVDVPAATVYRELMETATQAEELGFWSFWVTEHHFGSDATYRPYEVSEEVYANTDYDLSVDPLALLMSVAARTSQVRLGTAVAITHWDHPVRMTEKAAMLDVLSGGRLEFGVGRGGGFREIDLFEVPSDPAANNRKYHEAIEIVRGLWSGEPFSFDGEFYRLPELVLTPPPIQPEPPLWVGSASLDSAGWAARQHLPYATITWPLTKLEMYAAKRELFEAEAAKVDFDASDKGLPHVLFMYCGESDDEAESTAREWLLQYQYILEQHYENQRYHGEDRTVFAAASSMFADLEGLAQFPIDNHIIGGPATCAERIERFQKDLGVDYFLLNVGWGAMPQDLTTPSVRRFAEEVMPGFNPVAPPVAAAV